MYESGNYYLVLQYYVTNTNERVELCASATSRFVAENTYHTALASLATRVGNGTNKCGGAVLLKGTGAILAKQNFYNKETA